MTGRPSGSITSVGSNVTAGERLIPPPVSELPSGLQFPTRTDVWTPLAFGDNYLKNRWTLNLAAVVKLYR